ncbi:MAG TPA: anti-sigma factor [Saprospiraceae bacterium]|nr:anti-sigma factor [Saprospiraceae bacterium]HPN68903.1 anti-sigma factor [Saprospiraceae bacterium]
MTKEEFINSGLLEEFVLGLTSEHQDKVVLEHLDMYPDLCPQLKKWEFSLEELARKNAIAPSSDLKNRLQQKLDFHDTNSAAILKKANNTSLINRKFWMNIAATYLLFATLGLIYFAYQNRQLSKQSEQLVMENAKLSAEKNDLESVNRKFSFVREVETQVLQFSDKNKPVGTVFINHSLQKTSFKISNLASPPAQKVFQMWADVDGEMVSLGVLDAPQNGDLIDLPYMKNATSLNITIEPLGGSKTPTVANLVATIVI